MKKLLICSIKKIALKAFILGALMIFLPGVNLAQYGEGAAADGAYKLTQPVGDEDLNKILQWIGKETSRKKVSFCWKDTYARQTYPNKQECENKENGECIQLGLLWYVKCKPGYTTSIVPHCLMECPKVNQVIAGAPNVKVDCGLVCGLNPDACAIGVSDMVFAPINLTLNILTLGLSSSAANAAKNAALGGANAAAGGVTKVALNTNFPKLLMAIQKAEEILTPLIDAKDQLEYAKARIDDLGAELERWNQHFESNFAEYTTYRIDQTINRHFPDRDDRKFIKRAYGQYQLNTMLESDGWRISKAILSAASIEPLGLVATINAFAHPVCRVNGPPFPNVTIIPKFDRYTMHPTVKFHAEWSLTLEQARKIAADNLWSLATSTEVSKAWSSGQLDVYAYGRMSDGTFAVPVQKDFPNFKKGVNLNAAGGNQGFFYTEGSYLLMPPASKGFVRIQNNWNPKNYLHNEGNRLSIGEIKPNWWSSQWKLIPTIFGFVRIQNKWKPNEYLHNQYGNIELTQVQDPNWHSNQWKIIPVGGGWARIQNRWKPNEYLHTQNGKIEVGPIHNGWTSALWKVE